jgi:hypothetical protein
MLFDSRTREKLRAAGLDDETLREIESTVAEEVSEEAAAIEDFFAALGATGPDAEPVTVYSDMDKTHSRADFPAHEVRYVDCYTHAQDLRGWIRFDDWGAYVEDGRVLSEEIVELTLGPTVHERVRFAADREHLQ